MNQKIIDDKAVEISCEGPGLAHTLDVSCFSNQGPICLNFYSAVSDDECWLTLEEAKNLRDELNKAICTIESGEVV